MQLVWPDPGKQCCSDFESSWSNDSTECKWKMYPRKMLVSQTWSEANVLFVTSHVHISYTNWFRARVEVPLALNLSIGMSLTLLLRQVLHPAFVSFSKGSFVRVWPWEWELEIFNKIALCRVCTTSKRVGGCMPCGPHAQRLHQYGSPAPGPQAAWMPPTLHCTPTTHCKTHPHAFPTAARHGAALTPSALNRATLHHPLGQAQNTEAGKGRETPEIRGATT